MKKLTILALALMLVLSAAQAPVPAVHAQYGSEVIEYLGPAGQLPEGNYGCDWFETRIPLHFSGMTPGATYQIRTHFVATQILPFTLLYQSTIEVQQTVTSAEFDFWAVNFDANLLSGYGSPPVMARIQLGTTMARYTVGSVVAQVVVTVLTPTDDELYRVFFENFDCELGTFLFSGSDLM